MRRPDVAQIEPVIPIVLGCHGLAICLLTDAPRWAAPPFAGVVVLGVLGVAGWSGTGARLLRAAVCTVVPLVLSILEPSLVPAVLQWYYAVATVYPLVLVGWTAAAVGPLTGAAYVIQVLAGSAPVPLQVALLRAGVLAVLGLAAGSAGEAFRTAVHEAEQGRAAAERTGRELAFAATHDELTGLGNRTLLHDRAREALADDGRMALILFDLDRFREVNDALGHRYGDELLRQVGARLTALAPAEATLTRLGGDEFALVLPAGDAGSASALAEVLRTALEEPFQVEDALVSVDASAGIALAPEHATDSDRLLQLADAAMYAAKDNGRGSSVYRPEQAVPRAAQLSLLAELRQAITRGEFVLEYQPIIETGTGRAVGCEALVRWEHPTRGRLMPDSFIPLAERSGIIRPLTELILETAIADCAGWQDRLAGLRVAINLSVRNLQQDDLPSLVSGTLARHGLGPELLELEITESFLMADPARARQLLTQLHTCGVRIAVDDFGTGMASLSYLKHLPVDVLKIDKSFVTQMLEDERDSHIVRGIVDLAASLSLQTVAEGVEDEPTLRRLVSLGCAYAQGYGISRPVPAEAAFAWCLARNG